MKESIIERYWWVIKWVIVAMGFFFSLLAYERCPKSQPDLIYTMPSHPGEPVDGGYWSYDYQKRVWVKKYFEADRTMGNKKVREQSHEEEIQKYLEEHIKGYKEQTYWGQKYSPEDHDSDDDD